MNIKEQLSKEFSVSSKIVDNIVSLIDEGNTIPFIARYRKESTNSMDDQTLREFSNKLQSLRNIIEKKDDITKKIEEQGKLTDDIKKAIAAAKTLTELDDIYLPFKKAKRTRATIAKEKGLEPLADIIFMQSDDTKDIVSIANEYINTEADINTADDAIAGAMDIIADNISNTAVLRKRIREYTSKEGFLSVKGINKGDIKIKGSVYEMYSDYTQDIKSIPPHRILAINRGEKEGYLKVAFEVDEAQALGIIYREVLKPKSAAAFYVARSAKDAYGRLIAPAIEREIRNELTAAAEDSAVSVFSINLKNLLMQPPLKNKVTLGLDPAYRTGCKIAVVDATGKVLDTTVIYPTPPQPRIEESKRVLTALIKKHDVTTISIGNGTASRESEEFVAELLKEIDKDVSYIIVNEAGASVYSASKLAAEEFPEYDLTLRSAISIARRLQDPLAELVKIDPKSIGVGQYQHDASKAKLDSALAGVVENCVNSVGVDINTASEKLLSYIAGIGPAVAHNIIDYRNQIGSFTSRKQLLEVQKLGSKAYTQCAGFLRVANGDNPLDATGVHPESYSAAKALLKICRYTTDDIKAGKLSDIRKTVENIGIKKLAEEIGVGEITLKDIALELAKPGRDPRDELPPPILRKDVLDIESLEEGMKLKGTVRNVVDFGAFVDIGMHHDGLVHISKIVDRYIKHPSEVLKVGDIVEVTVTSVDKERGRIGLSMLKNE
ncbi:MAG: RNA-binding transcriptional accessory protein [Clostridia bacterium]|nr:RNA-binding transcriptional accessory protein [Clostridia bacterium]